MFSRCDCNARGTPLSLLRLAIGQTIKSATTAARISLAYLEACKQMQLTAVLESIQPVVLIGCCQFEGLSVVFWHTTGNITHIISHGMTLVSVLYDSFIKTYKLQNLQAVIYINSRCISDLN